MAVGSGFVALGGLATGLASAAQKQREEQQAREKLVFGQIGQAFTSTLGRGEFADPNAAMQFMVGLAQGYQKTGKVTMPKPGAELPPALQRVMGAIGTTDPALPGPTTMPPPVETPQAQPYTPSGYPRMLGRDELLQRDANRASALEGARRNTDFRLKMSDVGRLRAQFPGLQEREYYRMAGFPFPVVPPRWQPGTTIGSDLPDGETDVYGAPVDKTKHYRTRTLDDGTREFYPTNAPVGTGDRDLAQRASDYQARGFTADEALQLAHADRDRERQTKAKTAAQRLTLNDLAITERRDFNGGTLKMAQGMAIAARMAANDPSMTREDVIEMARELVTRSQGMARPSGATGSADLATLDAEWAALPHPAADAPAGTATPEEVRFWQAHPDYQPPAARRATAPAQTPTAAPMPLGLPPEVTQDTAKWNKPFAAGKLSPNQKDLVDAASSALQLIPLVTGPIEASGLQDEMGWKAGGRERWQAFLYGQGLTADEFNIRLQQYTGAVQAYILRALLRGRPNLQLQQLYGKHVPDPSVDSPGLIYRKTKELAKIINISVNTVLDNAQSTPAEIAAKLEKEFQATTVVSPEGVERKKRDEDAARRLRARQHLLAAKVEGKIPSGVTVDDALIEKFLTANPHFK